MARPCTVCTHAERPAIDAALVRGQESNRRIAPQYRLSEAAVRRHAETHLPARMVKAAEQKDIGHAIDVVQQLKAINAASLQVLKDAREKGQGGLALAAVDRVQRQIELQAKLIGQLDERPQVNVLVSAEWLQVRGALLAALAPHPAARAAVAESLTSLDAAA